MVYYYSSNTCKLYCGLVVTTLYAASLFSLWQYIIFYRPIACFVLKSSPDSSDGMWLITHTTVRHYSSTINRCRFHFHQSNLPFLTTYFENNYTFLINGVEHKVPNYPQKCCEALIMFKWTASPSKSFSGRIFEEMHSVIQSWVAEVIRIQKKGTVFW